MSLWTCRSIYPFSHPLMSSYPVCFILPLLRKFWCYDTCILPEELIDQIFLWLPFHEAARMGASDRNLTAIFQRLKQQQTTKNSTKSTTTNVNTAILLPSVSSDLPTVFAPTRGSPLHTLPLSILRFYLHHDLDALSNYLHLKSCLSNNRNIKKCNKSLRVIETNLMSLIRNGPREDMLRLLLENGDRIDITLEILDTLIKYTQDLYGSYRSGDSGDGHEQQQRHLQEAAEKLTSVLLRHRRYLTGDDLIINPC